FTIINNDGSDPINGTFAGLSENATVATYGGFAYKIHYAGGDGNDVVIAAADATPPVVLDVVDVTPDPRNTSVSTVDVVLSEVVNLATFDFNDVTLTLNGGSNLITGAVTVTFVSGTTYRINNLSGFTGADGTYVL